MDYYAPPPQMAEKTEVKEVVEKEEKETLLLALNGGRNVEWQVLERKVRVGVTRHRLSRLCVLVGRRTIPETKVERRWHGRR
jgi:hypothetical protein